MSFVFEHVDLDRAVAVMSALLPLCSIFFIYTCTAIQKSPENQTRKKQTIQREPVICCQHRSVLGFCFLSREVWPSDPVDSLRLLSWSFFSCWHSPQGTCMLFSQQILFTTDNCQKRNPTTTVGTRSCCCGWAFSDSSVHDSRKHRNVWTNVEGSLLLFLVCFYNCCHPVTLYPSASSLI